MVNNTSSVFDVLSFLSELNMSGGNVEPTAKQTSIFEKPAKMIALILGSLGLIANLFSIIAIANVRGRLTSNTR